MNPHMNVFWPIYQNLEQEVLRLGDSIQFDDDQRDVYSVRIGDLIVRCGTQIEALSKELYRIASGNSSPTTAQGNKRKLHFDMDCLNFLQGILHICDKEIFVISPKVQWADRELTPLKDADKLGGPEWKAAYHAVKHDAMGSIDQATVSALIEALGALYILNVYYGDLLGHALGSPKKHGSPAEEYLGSKMFAPSVYECLKLRLSDGVLTPEPIREKANEFIYVHRLNEEWVQRNLSPYQGLFQEFLDALAENSGSEEGMGPSQEENIARRMSIEPPNDSDMRGSVYSQLERVVADMRYSKDCDETVLNIPPQTGTEE